VPSLRLYDYPASGNCVKVRILLAHLGRDYERVETDIFGGDTLTEEYRAKNPARQTPLLEIDGRHLPESNAILWYLAEGSLYLPTDPLARAFVVRWLLFEQESVGGIAALRFRLHAGLLAPDDASVQARRAAGHRTLATLDAHLSDRAFLVDDVYSISDIANYCYVHVADEAGIELDDYPAVRGWLNRIERQPGFLNDLASLPATARVGQGLSIYG
jgi:glutathione S-transferase